MDTENNKFKAAWKLNNVPLLAERFKWQTYVSDYFEEFPWTNTGMLCNHNFHLHMKKTYAVFMKQLPHSYEIYFAWPAMKTNMGGDLADKNQTDLSLLI